MHTFRRVGTEFSKFGLWETEQLTLLGQTVGMRGSWLYLLALNKSRHLVRMGRNDYAY